MARSILGSIAGLVLCLAILFAPTAAAPSAPITVEGADSTWTSSLIDASGLASLWQAIRPLVQVQYARAVAVIGLDAPPESVQTALAAVAPHPLIQYPNNHRTLTLVPPANGPLLNGDEHLRAVAQYANAGGVMRLAYPPTLFKDTQPPNISEVRAELTATGVRILWKTDEYADSVVMYGEEAGVYPFQAADPLYVKEHALVLPGAGSERIYFYRIRATDRSGNVYESPDTELTATQSLYLPSILSKK